VATLKTIQPFRRERERERVGKDSIRAEATGKYGEEVKDTLFLGGGEKEHFIARRLPGNARSSFRLG
jgi:hypothetical protein